MNLLSKFLDIAVLVAGVGLFLYRDHKRRLSKEARPRDPYLNPGGALDAREAGAFPVTLMQGEAGPGAVLGEQARFQHTEVVGASGTGKNWFALLPQ